MKVSLMTCTGDRPEAFALCEHWMSRQTRSWHEWIVVDDGVARTQTTMKQKYVRRERQPQDFWHTLTMNIREGLSHVTGDVLLFVEDDDYYSPRYIARMVEEFDKPPMELEGMPNAPTTQIVGENCNVYYHVRGRAYYQFGNTYHASLCATGLRMSAKGILSNMLLDPNPFIDLRMWRESGLHRRLFCEKPRLVVGIKAMPGRTGACRGHNICDERYVADPDMMFLKQTIGDDWKHYEKFGRKQ